MFEHLNKVDPAQFVYGTIAVIGGIARYLNSYTNGAKFSLRIFLASAFVAGFSGWIFAQIGSSMGMPYAIVSVMAGTGGFFGEQTMKLVLEWVQEKTPLA